VSSKRRAATQEIAPGHSTGTVAELGCSRAARRKLGEINGVRGSRRNTQKNARSYEKLHPLSSLKFLAGEVVFLPFHDGKGQLFGASQN
jgi:hypothetical protein